MFANVHGSGTLETQCPQLIIHWCFNILKMDKVPHYPLIHMYHRLSWLKGFICSHIHDDVCSRTMVPTAALV